MSKVVDFLPPSVYRVLINRNMVHPPTKNEAFKFDMCLLGNCGKESICYIACSYVKTHSCIRNADDVVHAIKQQLTNIGLESTDSIPPRLITHNDDVLLNSQSPESVLLFRGAITTATSDQHPDQKLMVYCDACQEEICGKIHACQTCFDYDLCRECYPKHSKSHADGNHEFIVEAVRS